MTADRLLNSNWVNYETSHPVLPQGGSERPAHAAEPDLLPDWGTRAELAEDTGVQATLFSAPNLSVNALQPLSRQLYHPTGDPDFDRQVDALASRLTVSSSATVNVNNPFPTDKKAVSANTKRIIAQEILKAYENRPDIIDTVLEKGYLRIFIDSTPTPRDGVAETILYRHPVGPAFMNILIDDPGGAQTIQHEFTHAVDFMNASRLETDSAFLKAFTDLKSRMPQALKKAGLSTPPPLGHAFWRQESIVPGLRNYAFYTRAEFLAETVPMMSEEPNKLRQISLALYDLYTNQLKLKPNEPDPVKTGPLTQQKYVATGNADFDRRVEELADKLPVTVTAEPIEDGGKKPKNTQPASQDTRRIIAAQILKSYGQRSEIIDKVITRPNFHIFISTADNNDEGGKAHHGSHHKKLGPIPIPFWKEQNDYMFLDDKSTGGGLENPDNGYEVIVHEFAHLVEKLDVIGMEESEIFKKVHEEFKSHLDDALKAEDLNDKPKFGDEFWDRKTAVEGLRNYAFYSDAEFSAVTTELFLENPNQLREISPELFDLYADELGHPEKPLEPLV